MRMRWHNVCCIVKIHQMLALSSISIIYISTIHISPSKTIFYKAQLKNLHSFTYPFSHVTYILMSPSCSVELRNELDIAPGIKKLLVWEQKQIKYVMFLLQCRVLSGR